jgi:membrane protease YdiL (CAAX protease family)
MHTSYRRSTHRARSYRGERTFGGCLVYAGDTLLDKHLFVHRVSPGGFDWGPDADDDRACQLAIAIGVGLGAVVLGVLVTGVAVVALGLGQPDALSAVSRLPLWVKVLLVVTAAITEELVWRSYPIERLTELTGRVWVGAAVSAVVFLAIHFPAWGLIGAIPQAVFTLALVGVYVWSRNVVVSIVTHGVINALMILVLPVIL